VCATLVQVRAVLRTLLRPASPATGQHVTEFLYMLATLLLHFQVSQSLSVAPPFCPSQRTERLHDRLHYLVYHALYYYENDWACKPALAAGPPPARRAGQQSLLGLGFTRVLPARTPTAEQLRIVQHPLPRPPDAPHLVKIVAFAGTGKTSTLVQMTEAHPNIKFLLVVYNKSVRVMAEAQFPKANVTCKTVHQMAMAKAGFMFTKKLTSNLKAKDVLDSGLLAEDTTGKAGSQFRRAGQVQAALSSFMNSAEPEPELEHVPLVWRVGVAEEQLDAGQRAAVLADAVRVWRAMADREDFRVRMPHDGYLKVWQARRPSLQKVVEHEVLLVDEGQDMNPAMLDIFTRQATTRVIVGDPNQQIYMFRGAVNALDLINPTHTYYLTQSFRFGPEIAFVANKCISQFKGDDTRTLVGGKKVDNFIGVTVDPKKQTAYIGRTNMGVFNKLHSLLLVKGSVGRRVGLVGGVESYNLEDYLDIDRLRKGQKDKMQKFKNFASFDQLKSFAKNVDDIELLSKIKIVEKYEVPGLIARIRGGVVKDLKQADTVLSTVHKAKGLEFETVVLMDDFPDFPGPDLRQVAEDEANLIYVAITRAKTGLHLNGLVKRCLLTRSDFSLATYQSRTDRESPAYTALVEAFLCGQCDQLVSKAKDPRTPGGQQQEQGMVCVDAVNGRRLCGKCSDASMPHLAWFRLHSANQQGTKRRRE
jgi:F-box protein 18 (helicase)